MLLRRISLILILGIILMNFIACSSTGIFKKGIATLETDIKPTSKFEEQKIKSVSVIKFDGKYVKTVSGEIIDYIEISNKFTDDLLKKFYEMGQIDVALGEYEEKITETDTLEKKRGDIEIQGNSLQRSIEYKAAPYKKIETILSGRINKFLTGSGKTDKQEWDMSFIEITLKLTDTYTGAVYWITDMRGSIKDVVETIAQSISKGKYTEPLKVIQEEKAKKEEPKKEEAKKEEPKKVKK